MCVISFDNVSCNHVDRNVENLNFILQSDQIPQVISHVNAWPMVSSFIQPSVKDEHSNHAFAIVKKIYWYGCNDVKLAFPQTINFMLLDITLDLKT